MPEAVDGQCAVRCEALRLHRASGVLHSISNWVRRKVWCSAQALLLLCLWLASCKFSSSSLRRYGVGEGVFTTDVNTCTVEPEGMIGNYCNSWYKCCTLTVKLKNLCNLNEVQNTPELLPSQNWCLLCKPKRKKPKHFLIPNFFCARKTCAYV